MKKIRDWCLVVLICLPNMAFAHIDAVGIRVFDTHTYTSGYDERAEFWSGCPVIGDAIDTDCLADKAYDFAQSTGALLRVPGRNQFRESYKDLFLRWNDLGSTISVSRFMRKATGTGFYLPQGRGRYSPLSNVEWSSIRGDVDLLQQQMRTLEPESAQSLRERINALEDRLVGVDSSTASLLGTLSTLETVVKNLPSLSQVELDAQKAELDDRLSGFATRLAQVEQDVGNKADKSEVNDLEARVSSLENPVIRAPFTSAETTGFLAKVNEWLVKYWWIPVLLLLLGVIAWLLKSRKNTSVTEDVSTQDTPIVVVPSNLSSTRDVDQYETLHTQVVDLDTRVGVRLNRLEEVIDNAEGVLVRLDRIDEAVVELQNESKYLFQLTSDNKRVENVPDQDVLALLDIGQHLDLPVKDSKPPVVVRVVRGTFKGVDGPESDVLYLYGVDEQRHGLSFNASELAKRLRRGLLAREVSGINPKSRIGLQEKDYRRKVTVRYSGSTTGEAA